MKIPLTEDISSAPQIAGVFHHPLRKHRGVEGWFMEHLRVTDGVAEALPVPFESAGFP